MLVTLDFYGINLTLLYITKQNGMGLNSLYIGIGSMKSLTGYLKKLHQVH